MFRVIRNIAKTHDLKCCFFNRINRNTNHRALHNFSKNNVSNMLGKLYKIAAVTTFSVIFLGNTFVETYKAVSITKPYGENNNYQKFKNIIFGVLNGAFHGSFTGAFLAVPNVFFWIYAGCEHYYSNITKEEKDDRNGDMIEKYEYYLTEDIRFYFIPNGAYNMKKKAYTVSEGIEANNLRIFLRKLGILKNINE